MEKIARVQHFGSIFPSTSLVQPLSPSLHPDPTPIPSYIRIQYPNPIWVANRSPPHPPTHRISSFQYPDHRHNQFKFKFYLHFKLKMLNIKFNILQINLLFFEMKFRNKFNYSVPLNSFFHIFNRFFFGLGSRLSTHVGSDKVRVRLWNFEGFVK